MEVREQSPGKHTLCARRIILFVSPSVTSASLESGRLSLTHTHTHTLGLLQVRLESGFTESLAALSLSLW